MKKLLSFLALALCFVACQNESVEVVSNGDLADVVLTIDAPELGVTRADGDTNAAKNSAFGAIDFLTDADWANYDLRYILEVYAKDDDGINNSKPIYRERLVNCLDKYAPTTFELRLVPNRTYKFVVFADFVAEGSAEATDKLAIADLYYNTKDLHNVTAITTESTWGAMNEIRDAYFVTENVEIKNSLTKDLTLTRPFAKLRVIATDLDYIAGYSKPGYVEVKYHTEKIFKSFNAVNGNLNTAEMTGNELEYGYEVSKTIPYSAGYDAESTNQTLFTDYLLAKEGEQSTVNFTITVYEDKTKARKIHEHDFNTQIPIQRNHLTTLIGDILTTQANIQILINDNFADKEFVVGYKDPVFVESWGAGQSNANGNIEFIVKGENDFKVTVNGAAVSNGSLTIGEYVLESKAEQGNNLTFTVEELQATRALGAVEVLDGTMIVAADQNDEDEYNITLDLLIEHEDDTTDRAVYEYNGEILFGETLDTPDVKAAVEGNVVTLTWTAVEGATSYFVAMNDEEAIETTELTKVYTDLAWNTTYTFSVYAKSEKLTSVTTTVEATVEAEPVVEPEELAAPVVNATVDGKVVTLTWAAVENAGSYSVKVNDGEEKNIEKVTEYVFDGEYSTAYTFTVYAIPADTAKYAKSEGGTATATTGAKPTTPEATLTLAYDDTTVFAAEGGNGEIGYTVTNPIENTEVLATIDTEVTWITNLTVDDAKITFTVGANAGDAREAVITVTYGDKISENVTIKQAKAESTVEPEELAAIDADAYYTFKQATEMKGGKWYAIVYDNKAATGLTSNYGYLKITEAASRANGISLPATCAFGFLTTEGGYTIQQFDGKYMYQTGEYDSFNVNATLPADGGVWSVAVEGNEYTITNNTMSKFVQYDSGYNSYGCYATSKGSLPTLYELVEVDNTPMILSVAPSSLSFKADGESKTAEIETYGTSTINVSDDADWVTTSLEGNTVTVTAEANSGDAREATVTITYGDDSRTISVSQAEYKDPSTGGSEEFTTTISFKTKDQRTSYSTSEQIWVNEGVTITNVKGGSTSNVGDYADPARFYKSSTLTIQADGNINSIVVDCTGLDAKYVTPWGTATDGIVTINLDGTSSTYTIESLSAQARAYSITVTYTK